MENKEAPAAAAAVPEKESTSCFKSTVGEDASLLEKAKDQYKQFTGAQAGGEHWECLKNKVSSMFADPIPFFGGGAKDHGSTNNTTPPSVESH